MEAASTLDEAEESTLTPASDGGAWDELASAMAPSSTLASVGLFAGE
jgi:hypothetical protein